MEDYASNHGLFKRLMIEGGLVSLYSAFLILFQLIDSFKVKCPHAFRAL